MNKEDKPMTPTQARQFIVEFALDVGYDLFEELIVCPPELKEALSVLRKYAAKEE